MALSRLTPVEVLKMLARADPRRLPPDVASVVFRITGGLPLGVAAITGALASAASGAPQAGPALVERSRILDLEAAAGPDPQASVAGQALSQLVPDARWRSWLITLSPSLSSAEAQAVAETFLDVGRGEPIASDAEDMLAGNGWPCGGEPFIGDPFLRLLLQHQLYRREKGTPAAAVHEALRDRHDAVAAGPLGTSEPFRLCHSLAVGQAPLVVRRLRDAFDESSADDWVEAVRVIASAPYWGDRSRHQHTAEAEGEGQARGGCDPRRSVAVGEADAGDADEISRSVNRLLHAAWLLADPLAATDQEIEAALTDELRFLGSKHPTGKRVLSRAASNSQAWAHGGRRPALAATEGSDEGSC
jgi:hypothetical protein